MLESPTLLLVLWDCTLVNEVTVPACCMVTLSSQFIFPYGKALLSLVSDNPHPPFPMVILLLVTLSTHKHKCNVSSHAFPKGVLQGLFYFHFPYLSKSLTPLHCTLSEINTSTSLRCESPEENKSYILVGNEDSTTLLQFPPCLNGDVLHCKMTELLTVVTRLLQIAKNQED